jgi:hypothetical protein
MTASAVAEPAWRGLPRPGRAARVREGRPGRPGRAGRAGRAAGLAGLAIPDGLEPADIAWLAADTLAAAGLTDLDAEHDPAELALLLGEVVPPGQEQNAFEAMARLPHRQVAGVLTVIGRHHPDEKTAKLARKAACKAGTRQARSTI